MHATTNGRPRERILSRVGKDVHGAKTVARTLFRELKGQGMPNEQILAVASELIGLVTTELKEAHEEEEAETRVA